MLRLIIRGEKLRYPEFLKDNGTIGFVAPSFGCATEPYYSAFNNALNKFKEKGYNTLLGDNCYKDLGIGISNTPDLCARELNEMYANEESDVLISCGGGELMCEVVPFMDFEKIKNSKPKWYMGYSDNTNFTFLSTILADTAAIYGPCASSFGMEPWHEAIEDAFSLLKGEKLKFTSYDKWEKEGFKDEENPLVPYNVTEPVEVKRFPNEDVTFEGRLIGGCMDCLVNLMGTKFDKVRDFNEKYKEDGIIWFLEACELNVMSIRRTIWSMEQAGWFENVKGFLIGRPLCYGEEAFGINQYRAVTDILLKYNVPILMDLDIGHLPPMMPIISGSTAKGTSKGDKISIEYTMN